MKKQHSLLIAGILVALAAGFVLWPKASPPIANPVPKPTVTVRPTDGQAASTANERSPDVENLRKKAFELQADRKWAEAATTWEDYLSKLPTDDLHDQDRQEAECNLEVARSQVAEPVVEFNMPEPAEQDRPREVSKDNVLKWYPKGRKVRSFATASVTGRGSNPMGILQKSAFFAYQYVIEAETTVLSNDGVVVEFEVDLKDVVQRMAADPQEELELHLPDSPLLELVWVQIEAELRPIPAYRIFKTVMQALGTDDPHLKRLLTQFYDWLKRKGLDPIGDDPVAIAMKIDDLAGLRIKMKYVSGLGVTHADVLAGHVSDRRAMERLARNVSLFADYFVGMAAEKPGNAEFPLRCEDIAGLFAIGYDVEVSGDVVLKKAGEKEEDGERWINLEVVKGEVTVDAPESGGRRSATVRPLPGGEVWYSPPQRLVRRAKLKWDVKAYWDTPNSLLYGTKYVGKVTMQTDYWAAETNTTKADTK